MWSHMKTRLFQAASATNMDRRTNTKYLHVCMREQHKMPQQKSGLVGCALIVIRRQKSAALLCFPLTYHV